jgi:3-phytase
MRAKLAAAVATLMLVCASPAAAKVHLQFHGQEIVPTGTTFAGTTVGGLSSITYDRAHDVYYTLSDDPSQFQPVRYYTVGLAVHDGQLTGGDVSLQGVTTMLAPDGQPYAPFSVDPEGLALTKDRDLIFTSEGVANNLIDPFIRRYLLGGTFLSSLPVPADFLPDAAHTRGVRQNLGFESAGVSRDGHYLFTGTENALVQDGPAATVANGSPSRLMRYDLRSDTLDRQWIYVTDPVAEPPVPPTQFSVNGLVELLPLSDHKLIAMERSFSVGAPGTGNTIKLYEVTLPGGHGLRTVHKKLVLNVNDLGIPLDNVEGLTFGPRLHDGRRTVVLVSDNNFAATQFTQFLLFTLKQ